jgi:hypothetical protein
MPESKFVTKEVSLNSFILRVILVGILTLSLILFYDEKSTPLYFWGFLPCLSYIILLIGAVFFGYESKKSSFVWVFYGVSLATVISYLLPIIFIYVFKVEFHWGFVTLLYPFEVLVFSYLGWNLGK